MSVTETSVVLNDKGAIYLAQSRAAPGKKSVFEFDTHVPVNSDSANVEPDPRFTLANERTFLAWSRTSLALIGGGLAANHFIDFPSTAGRLAASATPVIFGAVLAIVSLRRWFAVQRAMRAGAPLPMPQTVVVLVAGICVLGTAIMLSMAFDAIAG